MKRTFVATVLAFPLVLAGGLVLPTHTPAVKAAPAGLNDGEGACSLHQLAGRWGYTYSGAITAGPAAGPAASVGSFTQDAAGNIKGSQTRSFNGDAEDETLARTITVNPNCTAQGTVNVFLDGTLERTSVLNAVYVDNQRGLRAIFTTPFTVITIEGRKSLRSERKGCTARRQIGSN
jgi:hypothetical protein